MIPLALGAFVAGTVPVSPELVTFEPCAAVLGRTSARPVLGDVASALGFEHRYVTSAFELTEILARPPAALHAVTIGEDETVVVACFLTERELVAARLRLASADVPVRTGRYFTSEAKIHWLGVEAGWLWRRSKDARVLLEIEGVGSRTTGPRGWETALVGGASPAYRRRWSRAWFERNLGAGDQTAFAAWRMGDAGAPAPLLSAPSSVSFEPGRRVRVEGRAELGDEPADVALWFEILAPPGIDVRFHDDGLDLELATMDKPGRPRAIVGAVAWMGARADRAAWACHQITIVGGDVGAWPRVTTAAWLFALLVLMLMLAIDALRARAVK